MANTTDIVRMLNLLPYFEKHPGRSVMAAASDLGVDPAELMADLNRLFCCGPGVMPDQLVDLDHGFSSVKVLDSQGLDMPLRLTPTEAGALLLALESLESIPGLVDKSAVRSAAAKLRGLAATEAVAVIDSASVIETGETEETMSKLHAAFDTNKVITFDYYSRSKDETSHREASPIRLFSHDGQVYLYAFDHKVNEHRRFLVDMMKNVEVTTVNAQIRQVPSFKPTDPFRFATSTHTARVEFHKDAVWLADTIFCDIESVAQDGTVTAVLPLVSSDWLVQFALSNADRVRIIEPGDLAATVRNRANIALAGYDDL